MIDKEQIKDLMRNCSKGQYEQLKEHIRIDDLRFYTIKNYRLGIKYDEEGTFAVDLIFLSEEDEENFLRESPCFWWCSEKLGKYYLNKYSFLHEKMSNPCFLNIRHEIYNSKGSLVLYWYGK